MIIERILNNNVVISLDGHRQEMVVMGKGIAFNKKIGDATDPDKVEKVFSLNTPFSEQFKALLNLVPASCISATEAIIALANDNLPGKLHHSLLISLVDHVYYALQRFSQNIHIPNALLWEIKKLYPQEFALGTQALQIIAEQTGSQLPEDEAGFIALHLVNAQLNDNMQNTVQITRFMQDILSLVQYHFDLVYEEEGLRYQRFVTHLKFFACRVLDHQHIDGDDPALAELVQQQYPAAQRCTDKINQYTELHHDHSLTQDEKMFLTIHIEQLRK